MKRNKLKQNSSLIPFTFHNFNQYSKKQEKLISIIQSQYQPQQNTEFNKQPTPEYMSALHERFSEIALRAIHFWILVRNILSKIIDKDRYFDFHRYTI